MTENPTSPSPSPTPGPAPSPGPLPEARQLLIALQQKAPAELKADLTRLDGLLGQLAQRGEDKDAAALRKQIDDLMKAQDSFTSTMVHEIRKPMTTIKGYSDMLAKPGLIGQLNDQQQMFIDTIRNNVLRMEWLVADISDINRLNSGRLKLEAKMTTVGQVIMEVQKQAEPFVAQYEHKATWEAPQGLPILTADGKQLAKVLFKLVHNAIQYTPKGGQIAVRAARVEGNSVQFSVSDTGIGMKDEEISRLGEPFFRADHELVTSQKGYGLGIPVAMGFPS
jgi:signal transduction histidine kinase